MEIAAFAPARAPWHSRAVTIAMADLRALTPVLPASMTTKSPSIQALRKLRISDQRRWMVAFLIISPTDYVTSSTTPRTAVSCVRRLILNGKSISTWLRSVNSPIPCLVPFMPTLSAHSLTLARETDKPCIPPSLRFLLSSLLPTFSWLSYPLGGLMSYAS